MKTSKMVTLSKMIGAIFILSLITCFLVFVVPYNLGQRDSIDGTPNLTLTRPVVSIPEPYYTGSRNPNLTFLDLLDVCLNETMPHEYEKDVFDCSEEAAYMEWYLESHGFDTVIGMNEDQSHAYVVVRLHNRYYLVIFPLPYGEILEYEDVYDCPPAIMFEDIYEVAEYEMREKPLIPSWWDEEKYQKAIQSEWDWWSEVNFTAVNS